jgi:hypothetical protein
VAELHLISGHPLLVQAAIDAARQWRYQPTALNGAPVEVSTTITVTFVTDGGVPTDQTTALTGTWKAQDVAYAPWTLNLRVEGNTVKSTVSQGPFNPANGYTTSLTEPVEIYDGTIHGNTVSFKCDSPDRGERTITLIGEINGDEITFTRHVQVHSGGDPGLDGIYGATSAFHFTAKRDSSDR